jgi:galactokinase
MTPPPRLPWRLQGGAPEGEALAAGSELARAVSWIASRADFFDPRRPLVLARAPGRLDLMGGIADYSGSLVLELPLGAATFVAAQETGGEEVVIESDQLGDPEAEARVTFALTELAAGEAPLDIATARALFARDPRRAWSAYVLGAVVILHREHGVRPRAMRLLIRSDVPTGKGVSSSAALEVAALEAIAALEGLALDGRALALLAQKVENFIVGAPCGVMDQLTSACGQAEHLLELLCQPAELLGSLPLPPTIEVFGIDSGVRHAVSGADYGSVRVAAFMGYRLIAAAAGLTARSVGPGRVAIDDPIFGGYLANVTPSRWRGEFRALIPELLVGARFLAEFEGTTDPATRVDPARSYRVRAATEHPIEEHQRVRLFRAILAGGAASEESRTLLGELMYEAHASYSACGLGAAATDRLVELVRAAGPAAGLYGAKITGGGSGGTVAVLARRGDRAAVDAIAARHGEETGRAPVVFAGSSPGAHAFGVRLFAVAT